MKIAPVLLGAVFAQSSGDSEDVYAATTDDRWDSWGADNTFVVDSEGKAYNGLYPTADRKTVQAVTCWESNNMGDLSHYTTQNDDGFGWSNIHHGHDQKADALHISTDDNDYQVGTYMDGQTPGTSPNKLDLHSLLAYDNRYSGCIYEVPDWVYDSNSYNRMWRVQYGWDGSALTPSGVDASVTGSEIRTNWWHYFNAHIVINDQVGDANNAKTHHIAMANPSYEGLGYLNFIATFALGNAAFASDEWNTGRYGKNFNTQNTVTDLYSGGYAFDITPGDSDATWYSVYSDSATQTAGTWNTYAAVSSFPHNDLGKDFRFNVRVLHKGGDGDASSTGTKDSYYFYRINKIAIEFPYTVRCPREATNVDSDTPTDTFRCMDSAGYNGHRAWNKGTANPQSNAAENENTAIYIETLGGGAPGTPAADFCTNAQTDGRWYKCGASYNVVGLLNTYDEHGQQEFGTHQEFWFQFEYHFEFTSIQAPTGNEQITTSTNDNYQIYNLPNILFNAFELSTVTFECSLADQSRNQCL